MKAAAKDGWHAKPLEEIATFSNGLWKGKKGPFRKVKVLRNTNFRIHGAISFDDVAEIDVECKQFEKRQLRNGDIILERSGGGPKQPVGRVVLFELEDDNYSFSNFTSIVRVVDQSRLDPRFLHQVLNWWHSAGWTEQIQSRSTGIRNLDFKAYKQFLVPLPPLEDQRRIVAVLDEAFEGLDCARAHVEANIIDVDELLTRYLDDRLSQLRARVGRISIAEIADVKGGKRLPKGVRPDPKPTSFPYITVSDMTEDGTVSYGKLRYISEEVQEAISRYTISCRDVYVSIAGSIGKSGIAPDSLDGANLTENAAKLVLFYGWDKGYIYWCTRSTDFGKQVAQQTRVAAQPKLALRRLGEITIPDASLRQQLDIARKMGEVRAASAVLARTYRCKCVDLNVLRESLLQRAFAGELT